MGFINSYKKLEKLCGEIFDAPAHGVTEYIEEMERTTNGKFYVAGWGEDYKTLKRYRYLRNKIVHEPNCSEENMCTEKDTQWIENFHSRIMRRQDPISLYEKATSKKTARQRKAVSKTAGSRQNSVKKPIKTKKSVFLKAMCFVIGLLLFILIVNFIIKGGLIAEFFI